MVRKDLIVGNFSDLGFDIDDDVVNKCVELCIRYNLDEDALVNTWMAYSLSSAEDMKPTVDSFLLIEKKMLSKSSGTPVSTKKRTPVSHYEDVAMVESWDADYTSNCGTSKSSDPDSLNERAAVTPIQSRFRSKDDSAKFAFHSPRSLFSPASFSPAAVAPSKKYSDRSNSGDVVSRFGNNGESTSWQTSTYAPQAVSFASDFKHIPADARFMFENIASKIAECRKLADSLCLDIVESHKTNVPIETNRMSMETATYAGRVVCDSNGKLNTSSILLESCLSSNKLSENVQLQVNDVKEYSLFPGQIVVIEGRNPTGAKIIAEKLHTDVKLPMCPMPKEFLEPREPLQIVVAAGPYTLSDTLSYQPWQDLSDYVIRMKPHVLILIGPIVDSLHPLAGSISETFLSLYERKLLSLLDQLLDPTLKIHTKVVFVSSWREAAQLSVYPTPVLRSSKLDRPNLLLAPDPCLLNINGFHVGITSVDILMHLGKEELFCSTSGPGVDRLGRLASHLLQQKNFYPLMPPAEEMSVDVGLLVEHALLPYRPHMLILPSELKHFVKNLNGCIVVNPEKLSKGQTGGTFARVEVTAAVDGGTWNPETHVSVQIVKI